MDIDKVTQWNWWLFTRTAHHGVYAVAKVKQEDGSYRSVLLHRHLMKPPAGMQVDHIDGDGLNCRRSNMRLVTPAENSQNQRRRREGYSSQYKGVCRHKTGWRASIKCNGIASYLGSYRNEEDAAEAYNVAAKELFGEFACLNEVAR